MTTRSQGEVVKLTPSISHDPGDGGWLFGFDIAQLPDFLLDHTLLGQEPSERIKEHWDRWCQMISVLWRETEDVTYALKYDWEPVKGTISVSLMVRVHERSSEAKARLIQENLVVLMRSFGIDAYPMSSSDLQRNSMHLDNLLNANSPHSYQIAQEETLVAIRLHEANPTVELPPEFVYNENQDRGYRLLYELRPWWGPGGTFLTPFTILSSQKVPVTVCALLSPVIMPDELRHSLAQIARESESSAQIQDMGRFAGGVQVQSSQNRTDPQLRWTARLYAAHLRRLSHPFLVAMFCFSLDQEACKQVAHAFASAMREDRSNDPPIGETEPLDSGADAVYIGQENSEANKWALCACKYLNFHWILGNAPSTKLPQNAHADKAKLYQLRYVSDARGAAMAFRLPVNLRGGILGIAVHQRPPDFHPGPCLSSVPSSHIDLGDFHSGGKASVPMDAFTKHALIVGFTGSGKTVTVMRILHQLWIDHNIPFLVIESAKQEYRGLINVQEFKNKPTKLRVYTLGNETVVPFRLNPFELLPGVRVEAHISKLLVCFEASMERVGPSSSVLAVSLYNVYNRCGWNLTDRHPMNRTPNRKFPTISLFLDEIEQEIKRRKYSPQVEGDITAALVGRLLPLTVGSKGRMFDTQRSVPSLTDLYTLPTVLELNDLSLDDKALVTMFLLVFLREYRELTKVSAPNPQNSSQLKHITVVEEAHNVLEEVASKDTGEGSAADTRYKSVQAFCSMLTEIRALGEGLIIADQSPEKLARDAIRNTNIQIAHQLRDSVDREAIAKAMIMDDEQRDFLGKLKPGKAALFFTGLEKATFIQVPKYLPDKQDHSAGFVTEDQKNPNHRERVYRGYGFMSVCPDKSVVDHMRNVDPAALKHKSPALPFLGCQYCGVKATCAHRDVVFPYTQDESFCKSLDKEILALKMEIEDEKSKKPKTTAPIYNRLVRAGMKVAKMAGLNGNLDAVWCFFLHKYYSYDFDFVKNQDNKLVRENFEIIHQQEEKTNAGN